MNMQISPTSTHSHQLRDPLVDNHIDLIGYKVVCDVRNTSKSLVHCSFKKKILSNGVDLWVCTRL